MATMSTSPTGSHPRGPDRRSYRKTSDIRDRLREWEGANPAAPYSLLQDIPFDEKMGNFLTRSQTLRTFSEDPQGAESMDVYDGDVLANLRSQTSALLPGDLVETRCAGFLFDNLQLKLTRTQIWRYSASSSRHLPGPS